MLHRHMPCVYFPTKVLFVDDNENYLKNVGFTLDKCINYQTYLNPKKLSKHLLTYPTYLDFAGKYFISSEESEDVEGKVIQHSTVVDIPRIHKEIQNPQRFDQVSVLLVDYAMPGMNGIEFFKTLKDFPFKKVMVTGEADYAIAVNAFNAGIIDRFLMKDDPDFFEKVNSTIFELQKIYFQEISVPLINSLSTNPFFCLTNPDFIEFVYKIILENKIIEFYLVDEVGSFLMLDFYGKPTWFIVKDDKELLGYCDIASQCENVEFIRKELALRKRIPFFVGDKDWEIPVEEWAPYLHPAHSFDKERKYYYSILEGSSIYDPQLEGMFTYRDYLKKKEN